MISFDEYKTLSTVCNTATNLDQCIFSGEILENIGKNTQEPWTNYITCSWNDKRQTLKRIDGDMHLIVGDEGGTLGCKLQPIITSKMKIR